jgi:hypothetical protein
LRPTATGTQMRQLCSQGFIEVADPTFLVCADSFRHTSNDW